MFDQLVLRRSVFMWLDHLCPEPGSTVLWPQLKSFTFQGETIHLIGAAGIWKPSQLELPISITTAPPRAGRPRPYNDEITDSGLLRYKYQGEDPLNHFNAGLRRCFETETPLVYFHGISKGVYLPTWPVFIVGDNPDQLEFAVAVEDPDVLRADLTVEAVDEAKRRYYSTITQRRLHQAKFRDRVLAAYRSQCAICSLKHTELLEAAHIIPDRSHGGEPVVANGLSLCKIHHAAYDNHILGIRPDAVVELRNDLLTEKDGPMLQFGLQAFHGASLLLPRQPENRPDAKRLEQRYEEFRAAS